MENTKTMEIRKLPNGDVRITLGLGGAQELERWMNMSLNMLEKHYTDLGVFGHLHKRLDALVNFDYQTGEPVKLWKFSEEQAKAAIRWFGKATDNDYDSVGIPDLLALKKLHELAGWPIRPELQNAIDRKIVKSYDEIAGGGLREDFLEALRLTEKD